MILQCAFIKHVSQLTIDNVDKSYEHESVLAISFCISGTCVITVVGAVGNFSNVNLTFWDSHSPGCCSRGCLVGVAGIV